MASFNTAVLFFLHFFFWTFIIGEWNKLLFLLLLSLSFSQYSGIEVFRFSFAFYSSLFIVVFLSEYFKRIKKLIALVVIVANAGTFCRMLSSKEEASKKHINERQRCNKRIVEATINIYNKIGNINMPVDCASVLFFTSKIFSIYTSLFFLSRQQERAKIEVEERRWCDNDGGEKN